MKRNKFFQKKVVVDGIKFDSQTEADEYVRLKDMQEKGLISHLERQVEFEIIPQLKKIVEKRLKTKVKYVERTDERAAYYTCDFRYVQDGKVVILEVKSRITAKLADYILRRKLMKRMIHEWNLAIGKEKYIFKEIVR